MDFEIGKWVRNGLWTTLVSGNYLGSFLNISFINTKTIGMTTLLDLLVKDLFKWQISWSSFIIIAKLADYFDGLTNLKYFLPLGVLTTGLGLLGSLLIVNVIRSLYLTMPEMFGPEINLTDEKMLKRCRS